MFKGSYTNIFVFLRLTAASSYCTSYLSALVNWNCTLTHNEMSLLKNSEGLKYWPS